MRPKYRALTVAVASGAVILIAILSVMQGARHQLAVRKSHPPYPDPPRPESGTVIEPNSSLQEILDNAPIGAVYLLSPGVYRGPIHIRQPVTLWGPREAVVHSMQGGCTITVDAHCVRILGITVDGSGDRPDQKDAAVYVRGNDVTVEGVRIDHALFGIVADQCNRLTIIGNEIIGDPNTPIGLRGDGIQLWETRESSIIRNHLRHSRDVLLQYSPSNQVIENVCEHGRYGTHLMYSGGAVIRGNQYRHNTVGVFVMYSRSIDIIENEMSHSNEYGGMGIGIKESGGLTIRTNRLIHNNTGIYFDNSPFDRRDSIEVTDNQIALCETGITFLSSAHRSTFARNRFRSNGQSVQVEGHGDALAVTWNGNDFDDYQGYDLDEDGFGDVPYELRSCASQITGPYPDVTFFRGCVPLATIEAVGRLLPIFTPQPLLIDRRPWISDSGM